MSMPQSIHAVCDTEPCLDQLGQAIQNATSNPFHWPQTTQGYRQALWAVIQPDPLIALDPTAPQGIWYPLYLFSR